MGSVWVARMKGIPSIVGAVRVGGFLEARVGYLSTARVKMGLQNPYKYKYSWGGLGGGIAFRPSFAHSGRNQNTWPKCKEKQRN